MKTKEIIHPATYWEDMEWASKHLRELYEQYEGCWVAIADESVVAAGSNPDKVKRQAARKTGRAEEDVTIKFIPWLGQIFYAH